MTTTKKAAVSNANANSFDARLSQLEKQIADLTNLLAQQTSKPSVSKSVSKGSSKPKTKATTKKANAAKAVKPEINVDIPGKPKDIYIDRDWCWIGWSDKPTDKTLKALKSNGWYYSAKRKQWHKPNVA